MKRRDILRTIALLPVAAVAGPYALFGKGLVDEFRERYADLRSVDLSFKQRAFQGRLQAKKGGFYRIEAGDRTFVCDGKTVWNVQESSQTVVIDRYDAEADTMSVDRIFFVLMNVYVPTVKRSGAAPIIRLSPPEASATIVGVDHADVHLTSSHAISQIDVSEHGVSTSWSISKLRRNPNLPDAVFTYQPPKGWTVVDLR